MVGSNDDGRWECSIACSCSLLPCRVYTPPVLPSIARHGPFPNKGRGSLHDLDSGTAKSVRIATRSPASLLSFLSFPFLSLSFDLGHTANVSRMSHGRQISRPLLQHPQNPES